MRKINQETIDKVRALLKCGLTGYEVAEKAGVSVSTVTKLRKGLQEQGFQIWHPNGGVVSSRMF